MTGPRSLPEPKRPLTNVLSLFVHFVSFVVQLDRDDSGRQSLHPMSRRGFARTEVLEVIHRGFQVRELLRDGSQPLADRRAEHVGRRLGSEIDDQLRAPDRLIEAARQLGHEVIPLKFSPWSWRSG